MSYSRREALLALPASAVMAGFAAGQPTREAPVAAATDPQFAPCLLIGGRKQVENCTFALTKLQSDDAKAFAKAEIAEHETMKKQLKGLGYDYPLAPATAGAGRAKVTAGTAPVSADAAAMIVLDHEVADQCIVNYRAEMGKLAGREFDKRFVGHQLDEHMALLDNVQTFRKHATPEMETVLADGQKTIEAHIAALKGMMASLDGKAKSD